MAIGPDNEATIRAAESIFNETARELQLFNVGLSTRTVDSLRAITLEFYFFSRFFRALSQGAAPEELGLFGTIHAVVSAEAGEDLRPEEPPIPLETEKLVASLCIKFGRKINSFCKNVMKLCPWLL